MESKLSVRECIRYGWETFKKRPWFLIGVTLLIGVINVLIPGPDDNQSVALIIVLTLVSILVGVLVQLGSTNFALRAHDDVMTTRLKDLWRPDLYLQFLGALVVLFIIVGIPFLIGIGLAAAAYFFIGGEVFLVIALPLLILFVMIGVSLYFFAYLVVDRQLGPIAAIRESFRLTKGYRWKVFQLMIVAALLNLLGLVCLVVGLLVSLPVTVLATVHAYRILGGAKSTLPATTSPEPLPTTI